MTTGLKCSVIEDPASMCDDEHLSEDPAKVLVGEALRDGLGTISEANAADT